MSELKILFPEHETVQIGRITAKIYPAKLKHVESFSRAASGLITLMADATAANMAGYAAKNTPALKSLLATCTDLSHRQIAGLSIVESIMLGFQVVRVNFDFFAQALPQVLASLPDGAGSSSD